MCRDFSLLWVKKQSSDLEDWDEAVRSLSRFFGHFASYGLAHGIVVWSVVVSWSDEWSEYGSQEETKYSAENKGDDQPKAKNQLKQLEQGSVNSAESVEYGNKNNHGEARKSKNSDSWHIKLPSFVKEIVVVL